MPIRCHPRFRSRPSHNLLQRTKLQRALNRSGAAPAMLVRVESLEARQLLAADVVIDEIMFHPITSLATPTYDLGSEYIEIYNRGNASADLTGWQFTKGVDFTFSSGSLAPGQYLVVAANPTRFAQKYPGVTNFVGGWTGQLSNSQEGVRLVDSTGATVDSVTYADQGDWATRQYGTEPLKSVSSLTRSGTTVTVTLPNHGYANGNYIKISGAVESGYNGTFTIAGVTTNTFTYTISTTPTSPATGTITAQSAPDFGHIGWDWVQPADGGGSSLELINPLVSNDQGQNWKSSATVQGTPEAANSVAASNIAPMILDVAHAPLIPKSTDTVTVTAKLVDELGTASAATLFWRIDALTPNAFASIAMHDDGTAGDAVAHDGIWSAQVTPKTDKTIVEFYVSATDGTLTRTWPAPDTLGRQIANALYQVDNTVYPGTQPIFRLIVRAADAAELVDIGNGASTGQPASEQDTNAGMNATLISLDSVGSDIRYNVDVRNRGHGSRLGPPNNYRVNVPSDNPWHATPQTVLAENSDFGRTIASLCDFSFSAKKVAQNAGKSEELCAFKAKTVCGVAWHGMRHMNINCRYVEAQLVGAAVYQRLGIQVPDASDIQVRINGTNLAQSGNYQWGSYVLLEDPDSDWAGNHFPNDPQGNYYANFRLDPAGVPEAELRYEGTNPVTYEDRYIKGTNTELNDYSDLIHLVDVLNNAPDATYLHDVNQVLNVDEWLHYLAMDSLLLNWETGLNRGIGDDYGMYCGVSDPRFLLVPHDLDTIMGQGNATTTVNYSIFGFTAVDGLNRFLNHPDILPLFYHAFIDDVNTVFNPTVMNPLIDQMIGGFVSASVVAAMKQFVIDRTAGVLAQIPQTYTASLALPTQNGYYYTTNQSVPVSGTANTATTRSVTVNGQLATWDAKTGQWVLSTSGGTGATQTLVKAGVQGTQGSPGVPGAAGDIWKYLADGSNQGTAWHDLNYVDTAWPQGPSQLGYGDGDENTPVPYVDTDPNTSGVQKNITTYFRKKFTVVDKSQIASLTMKVLRDDGVVVWLNGQQVSLPTSPTNVGNMPASAGYQTPALGNVSSETTFYSFTVSPAMLVNGDNILAVEIHQYSATASGDISFDLGLTATMVATGTGGVPLNPGVNRLLVQAFDGKTATGNEVWRQTLDVLYDGASVAGYPPAATADVQSIELLMPATYLPNQPILVQVQALDSTGAIQRDLWDAIATLSTNRSDITLSTTQIVLRNGLGSVLVTPSGAGAAAGPFTLTATVNGKTTSMTLTSLSGQSMTIVSGTLSGNTTWSGIIHITSDVIVPAGTTLTINPGTLVLLDGVTTGTTGSDIEVRGKIQSLGTAANPVVITAYDTTKPWGNLYHVNAQPSLYQYTLISRAGNSPVAGGHTGTGPAFNLSNSAVTFDHSSLTDTVGKIAYTASGSSITMLYTHFARGIMGPEIEATALLMDHSWITEMYGSNDDDGIYLHGQQAGQTITLQHSVIATVDDDCIDTLSSTVLVNDCYIRNAKDKGVSVYSGVVTIQNSLIAENSQAPEDGTYASVSAKGLTDSSVTVNIDHTTIVGTGPTGIGIEGRNKDGHPNVAAIYNVTNSIIKAADPVRTDYNLSDIHISYSDVNGETYAGTGNLNVDPAFVDPTVTHNYHLKPGSPAANAGDPAAPTDPDGSSADQGVFLNSQPGTRPAKIIAATTLSGDWYLSPEDGAYHVTGNVTIPAGCTIYVLRGTTIEFDAGVGFNFNGGRLVAEGSALQQIRFTIVPGITSPWSGLQFTGSMLDNSISYAIIEYGGMATGALANMGMVGLTDSSLIIDHCYFDHTDRRRIRTTNSSLIVRNSQFTDIFPGTTAPTTDNLSEQINGSGISAGGQLLIENNLFGTTKGHNDIIDVGGATRPGAIPRIINNIFTGGGDDAIDLDHDAWIEGNTIRNFTKDSYNTSTGNSNAVSAQGGNVTIIRNTISNMQHAVQVKDGAFVIFVNNTVVGCSGNAIYFQSPTEPDPTGIGATIDSCIFVDTPTILGTTTGVAISVNHSIGTTSILALGTGNTTEDPRLVNKATGDFSLRPGSPAIKTGANGLSMGALVAGGATIFGEPWTTTAGRGAALTIGGAGIVSYKYKLNAGVYSAEIPVATPISLSGLADGAYTVYVIGKTDAGVWQTTPTASRTWTVSTVVPSVKISEFLAANNSAIPGAVVHAGSYPDLIELYNDGASTVNLNGMAITDTLGNRKYTFGPGTTITPGQYLTLYCDSKLTTGEIHVGFNLKKEGEGIYLYDTLAAGGGLIDGVTFGFQLDNLSVGRVADGSFGLMQPTFGSANIPLRTGDTSTLKINEWLAAGVAPFTDDFVELTNPDALPVSVGGLSLSDHPGTDPALNVIAALSFIGGGKQYDLVADGNAGNGANHLNFKLNYERGLLGLFDSSQKAIDFIQYGPQTLGWSQGRSPDGSTTIASFPQPSPGLSNPANLTPTLPLRITEIAYNPPAPGATYTSEDYEYIELKNVGASSLNLAGVQFVAGVIMTFGSVTVPAGGYVVVVKNPVAFTERYGSGITIAGTYADSLSDDGEEIRLLDSSGGMIQDFSYSDSWYKATDGDGYTLTMVNAAADPLTWAQVTSWKAGDAILRRKLSWP